jgi:hypothetical protein
MQPARDPQRGLIEMRHLRPGKASADLLGEPALGGQHAGRPRRHRRDGAG